MKTILDLLDKILEYYGQTAATIVLVVIMIVYCVYLITKNYSSAIKSYFDKRMDEQDKAHAEASRYRKSITPKIRHELSELAEEVGADRAMVFEFSNGSSNLIGLPFLYVSATYEVVGTHVSPVSHQYQRINTSIVAEFLEKLEDKAYFYAEDLDEIKFEQPILHSMMKPNKAKSLIFYALRGVEDSIGFVVATTTGENTFTRDDSLPKIASAAQVISSYLNFTRLHEGL